LIVHVNAEANNASPTVATVTVSAHRLILVIRIYSALQQLTNGLKFRGINWVTLACRAPALGPPPAGPVCLLR
jgi:hypothetical protein